MKNSIPLQQGLSLSEFQQMYGEESLCEAVVEQAQWPYGFICPKCSSKSHCIAIKTTTCLKASGVVWCKS